jgi:trehalose-phosphatase
MHDATRTPATSPASLSGATRGSLGTSAFSASDWWPLLERAPHSVLMLDFDGTLSPFVRERMNAKLYPGVAERLLLLSAAPRTRLVFVSGRPARDFAYLLPPDLHVEIFGSHGREHITADGRSTTIPLHPAQQQALTHLEADLLRNNLAPLLEKKVGSLAIHTRGLAEADAERIAVLVQNFYRALSSHALNPGLELLPFDGGIELRGSGCSKASAVESILRDEPPRVPAAYLGDDQTDEDAFAALAIRAPVGPSLCVLVRPLPRPSAADLWLTPPEELLAFLDRWLDAVTGSPRTEPAR